MARRPQARAAEMSRAHCMSMLISIRFSCCGGWLGEGGRGGRGDSLRPRGTRKRYCFHLSCLRVCVVAQVSPRDTGIPGIPRMLTPFVTGILGSTWGRGGPGGRALLGGHSWG